MWGPFRSPGCFYLLLYLDWALTQPIKTQIQIVIWGDCAAEELFSKASHPESEGCSPYRHLKVTHSWITCTITRIIKIQKINNWWWDITGMGLSTSTHCGGAFCLLSGTSNRLLPYLSDGEASFECYLVEDVVCWYLKETNSTVYCKAIVGFMSVDASFSSQHITVSYRLVHWRVCVRCWIGQCVCLSCLKLPPSIYMFDLKGEQIGRLHGGWLL